MRTIKIGAILFLSLFFNSHVLAADQAAISSAHPLATQAGFEILAKGGNAFDAAIAVTSMLAVVEPYGSGIGGGGFWLLYRARDKKSVMIDGRERAPLAAHADMYLDKERKPIKHASLDGPLAAGIPGEPAALVHLAKNYGSLSLKESLAPAIRYAQKGFKVTPHYRRLAKMRHSALLASLDATDIFLDDGQVPQLDYIIKQPDLAKTLKRIAKKGRKGFYGGHFARKMVKVVREAGGIWSLKDLQDYNIIEREPVRIHYRGLVITTASLPSSGGIVMAETLNMLSNINIEALPRWQRHHWIIEAMKLAYRDRALYLGDADFIKVDQKKLLSKQYARSLYKLINPKRALKSKNLRSIKTSEGQDTSHFSVIDKEGNRVAATLSVNYPFGSAFVPEGTGVVLNNEMDDFVMKPGVPNVYGLVGNEANAIEPGKRPLSSMTPTFLESKNKIVVLGTPGGSRIISMVLLATLEVATNRGAPKDWVSLPRYHHQYLPDSVTFEPKALSKKSQKQLIKIGHKLKERKRSYGNMHIVMLDKKSGSLIAASDPRGEGLGMVE